MAAIPDAYSFSDLLHMGRSELREELTKTVADLCHYIEHTAFLRSTEGRGAEYFESEGHRDALVEQKWLIMKLMEDAK